MVFELYDSNKPDNNKERQQVGTATVIMVGFLFLCMVFMTCIVMYLLGDIIYTSTLPTHYYESTVIGVGTEPGFRTTFIKAKLDNEQTAIVENGLMVSIGDKVKVKEILNRDKNKVVKSYISEVIDTNNEVKSDE